MHAAPPIRELMGEPLGELIGAGGFASVWALGERRVAKIAHASHALAKARIAREAEALANIAASAPDKLFVPRLHGTGVLPDGRAWLAMDRVDGTTVADITTHGPQRASDAVAIGLSTLDALDAIHRAGFVHRDIKPDNLVRTPAGRIVVLDLGLARKVPDDPDDPTAADVQVGSLEYMPPEQIENSAAVDARSDLYAFGCVLFELVAGRPPFVGDAAALERAHAALRPPRLGALVSVPAPLEQLCADCLAKEPARRPPSATHARARLAIGHDEPASKSGAQISMIRESKQPVVLLWIELPRVDRALLGVLAARRLVVASQRGRRVLAGAVGGEHGDPATIAIAAARDLAAHGARVALHLDAVRVSSTTGGTTLAGPPIDQPEHWLPQGAWTGIVMTRALAAVTQVPTRDSPAGEEFRALAADGEQRPLFGRDALLTDLMTDAAVALIGDVRKDPPAADGDDRPRRITRSGVRARRISGPGFALLVGDAGVGKTAVATELSRRLVELDVGVHLGTVPPPGAGKPHAALESLIGEPRGPLVRAIGDALRDVARRGPIAVILDDLHLADHDLFDALEYATLGGEPLPLWVIGIASPRIEHRRPHLGERAERYLRAELGPLDEDAAVALAADLLHPAEYPPLRALRQIASIAHGNPLHVATLVREIHERGAVRARPGGSHFLDTSALDDLSPAALGPWLAARELSGLAEEVVALARICAILAGDRTLARDEVIAIVEAAEHSGGATTTIDVGVGLGELENAGILSATERGYQFRQNLVEEGIYATTDPGERLALHRAALAYWRDRDDADAAEHVARHAEAVGDHAAAAAAFALLGRRALDTHHHFEADQAWSGALRHLDAADGARARALFGRGQARYRLQRMHEAVEDLEAATAIAAAIGDARLEIETLLETAIVLDHVEGVAGNTARCEQLAARARARLVASPARDLELDVDLADARSLYRGRRFGEIAETLRRIYDTARSLGRDQTATIASLLLGCTLSELHRLDESERVFDELIASCRSHADQFHLAAAVSNRALLWSPKGELHRELEDLREVIQLSREGGQAHFERIATNNLGEDRLWQGDLDEALQLAQRSLSLQSRAGEGTTLPDRLLLARVLAARNDVAELRPLLASFATEVLNDADRMLVAVLEESVADDGATTALAAAIAEPSLLGVSMRLELLHLAARRGALTPPLHQRAIALAPTDPFWASRIHEFDVAM